jgi:hypothetical protein
MDTDKICSLTLLHYSDSDRSNLTFYAFSQKHAASYWQTYSPYMRCQQNKYKHSNTKNIID